uniref:hypothetical protein n=1 Tax=Cyanobium sp. TaxID=2164130 RepID=UPI00404791CB
MLTRLGIGLLGIGVLASSSAIAVGSRGLARSESNNQNLVAQLTYKGYMSCQENMRLNCDIELNRKKSSIKELCYSVWTGNWPAGTKMDAATYQMYKDWCSDASFEIKEATREYPDLLKFVSRYRNFNPAEAEPLQTLGAVKNAETFLLKCQAKTANRAAEAMEIWGTRKHGDWTLRDLDDLVPSRYSEITSACDKKSWVHTLLSNSQPILISSWVSLKESSAGLLCKAPSQPKGWDEKLLERETSARDNLEGFLKVTNMLNQRTLTGNITALELKSLTSNSKERLDECKRVVGIGEEVIEERRARAEKDKQAKAAAEQEKIRRAAEAKVSAERNAAAARAEADRRNSDARAAAEAQRRKNAERKKLLNSVGF